MSSGSYSILGGDYDRAGMASRSLKDRLKRVGISADIVRRAVIAAYEAEMNVVIHAFKGTLRFTLAPSLLDIQVIDEGPGIADIGLAMKEGYSTASQAARELGFGAGMGLPNIKRNSDRFEIQSVVGEGTRLSIRINLDSKADAGPDASVPANSLHVMVEFCGECHHCVRACPTRAMRVRGGRPEILDHLCIDCAECIAACRTRALTVAEAKYCSPGRRQNGAIPGPKGRTCVVPAAVLLQFGQGTTPEQVLAAMASAGFAPVLVTDGHEIALRRAVARYAEDAGLAPVISPVCPAVVNLVQVRYPSLVKHLAPFVSPLEAACAGMVGKDVVGVVLCPAQCTVASVVGVAALSPATLRQAVTPHVKPGKPLKAVDSALRQRKAASSSEFAGVWEVSGIRHVISALENAENGLLSDVMVLEPYACDHGCFGSALLFEDPFIARGRWARSGRRTLPAEAALRRRMPFSTRPGLRLDPDMSKAIAKLAKIDEVTKSLPGKDCGMCGAPTCAALAEDIVLGVADRAACLFLHIKTEKRT